MRRGRTGVGNVSELASIVRWQEKCCEYNQSKKRAQDGGGHFLKRRHDMLPAKVRPAKSASEFAASITRATIKVTLTMSGRSRLRAACQASWPKPGESQSASIGMAAPKEMANDTPRRARSGGAANGRPSRNKMGGRPSPLAPAARTGGWAEGRNSRF